MKMNVLKLMAVSVLVSGVAYGEAEMKVEQVKFTYSDVTGVGRDAAYCRRDPSDVIKVGDTCYLWYTRTARDNFLTPLSSYNNSDVWWAASKDDGRTWEEKGCAIKRGESGAFDAFCTFTPNILVWKGKYYLYYTAVADGFKNTGYTESGKTRIGVAVAESPGGPWLKPKDNIMIEPSADHAKFDSYRVDDSCMIVRDGKVWLYYKGRQWENTPGHTKMGVAVADDPLGPFTRVNGGDHVQDSGHEVMVWPYREGVMSLVSSAGPHGNSLFYATDGASFKVVKPGLRGLPAAPGSFRADLSGVVAQRLSVARLGGFASAWTHLNGLLKLGGPPHRTWLCNLVALVPALGRLLARPRKPRLRQRHHESDLG
jgi:hypothetical protein